MDDDLTNRVAVLDQVMVPVTWADVEHRLDAEAAPLADVVPLAPSGSGPRTTRQRVLIAAAVVAVVGLVALLARPDDGAEPVNSGQDPTTTTPVPTTSTAPDQPTTTLPAIGTYRGAAVEVWTGSEYVVWSGQAGGDAYYRGDGWIFDPVTGNDTTIPPAPIGPRDSAAGVWTGSELLVCCGRSIVDEPGYETDTAAVFDPETGTWRVLADPPPEADGYVVGSAWTGSEMLVVVANDSAADIALLAYDPDADAWDIRAAPPQSDRIGTVVWTGDSLILWLTGFAQPPHRDRGSIYDPRTDTWQELPALPRDHPTWYGSAVWAGDQLVVWGSDQNVDSTTVGYSWRPGETGWRPMAPAPLAPIDWYEGTPGSQTMGYDARTGLVVAVAIDPGDGSTTRELLTYDPRTERWATIGQAPPLGYDRVMRIEDGNVYQPDVEQPIAFTVPG